MTVVLEARDITKVYGHVNALSGANFEVKAGEEPPLVDIQSSARGSRLMSPMSIPGIKTIHAA